jgi:hypothetical protein
MSEFWKTIKDDEFEVFQNSRVYDFSTLLLINNVQEKLRRSKFTVTCMHEKHMRII